jgi:plasmid stabilization system protein ParE
MRTYSLSSLARKDLVRIWKWIAWDNRQAATKVRTDILNACAMLAQHPEMGGLQPDWTARPLRFYVVRGNYWIVYNPEAKPLEILRVIHAARDVSTVLRDDN